MRLLLEAVKEWVEEVLNGFVKKDEVTKYTGRYNVTQYGVTPNDFSKKSENVTALQNLIDNAPVGAEIYFPVGLYLFNAGISITKSVRFIGESTNIQWTTSKPATTGTTQSALVLSGATEGTTFFKRRCTGEISFKGLYFYGESYKIAFNTEAFSAPPYEVFTDTITTENINGVDLINDGDGNDYQSSLTECFFHGFSGTALNVYQHKFIHRCGFLWNKIGITYNYSDNWLQNCWFCQNDIAILTKDSTNNFANLYVTDTWCDQAKTHFIKSINTGNNNFFLYNCWVDMIGGSAVNVESALCLKFEVTGRFSRCGMTYAGIADADRTDEVKPYADVFYFGNHVYTPNIDINVAKRALNTAPFLTQQRSNRQAPSKVVSCKTGKYLRDGMIKVLDTNIEDIVQVTTTTQSSNGITYEKKSTGILARVHVISLDADAIIHDYFWFTNDYAMKFHRKPNFVPHKKGLYVYDISTTPWTLYRSTGTANATDWEVVNDVAGAFLKESDIDFTALLGGVIS